MLWLRLFLTKSEKRGKFGKLNFNVHFKSTHSLYKSDVRREELGKNLAMLLEAQATAPLPISFGRPCIICGSSSGACATCTGCGAPFHATCAHQQALKFAYPYPNNNGLEDGLGGTVRLSVEQRGSWIFFEGLCGSCRKKKSSGGWQRSVVKVEASTNEMNTDMDIDESVSRMRTDKEGKASWARCEPATVTVLFGARRRRDEEAAAKIALYESDEAKGSERIEEDETEFLISKGKGKGKGKGKKRGKSKGKKQLRGRGKSGRHAKGGDSFSISDLRKIGVEWMESGELPFGKTSAQRDRKSHFSQSQPRDIAISCLPKTSPLKKWMMRWRVRERTGKAKT